MQEEHNKAQVSSSKWNDYIAAGEKLAEPLGKLELATRSKKATLKRLIVVTKKHLQELEKDLGINDTESLSVHGLDEYICWVNCGRFENLRSIELVFYLAVANLTAFALIES